MRIENSSNTNFQAKFILKDEAKLLKSCKKRFNKISQNFEKKTAAYPDDSFTLLLDKYNDTTFISKIWNYKDAIPLKDNALETLLSNNNKTIVNELVKVFNTAQKCAGLNKKADQFVKAVRNSSPQNKTLNSDLVYEFMQDAILSIKGNMIQKDDFLRKYVIKSLL